MKSILIKRVLAFLILGTATSLSAETLTFPMFSIEVETGWKHSIEGHSPASTERGGLISIFRPDGVGVLRIQLYVAPGDFSKARLRLLTNVEASTQLNWHEGEDFSGYHHSYTENGTFYKQWWLRNERTMLLIIYDYDAGVQQIEIEAVNKMVKSIKKNLP